MPPRDPYAPPSLARLGLAVLLGICAAMLLAPLAATPVLPQGASAAAAIAPADPPAVLGEGEKPRLAVLVVFDQLRGDYLSRWDHLFGEGGFHRLTREGAWFQNCHYPYAITVTGAGHASFLTGCSPATHGIISNDWFDRSLGKNVYCATLDRYEPVPGAGGGGKPAKEGGAPDRMIAPSLGDVLKEEKSEGRVVALSLKDRAAVLPGGHVPDACYWWDTNTGRFVTSTRYSFHSWVEEWNRKKLADRWFGRDWVRLRPTWNYSLYSGPDEVAGEGLGTKQGRSFPHPMTGGDRKAGKNYYNALYTSPFGNDVLLDFVKTAVVAEQLGQDDNPDLLTISFSSNDPVGHMWGPDSQEVLDCTLRSDLIVKELLTFLDKTVGKGRYVLALSADHGVCPLPEVARKTHPEARRVPQDKLFLAAEEFLDRKFGRRPDKKAKWFREVGGWLYFDTALLRQKNVNQTDAEESLAAWLKTQPGVHSVYTRTQLLKGISADDPIGMRMQKSFHPDRSGDLTIVPQPYCLITPYLQQTTHGTPWPYDTHVPLLVYGAGVKPGVRQDAVTPQAAAAILAHALGVKPPAKAEAPLPEDLFVE